MSYGGRIAILPGQSKAETLAEGAALARRQGFPHNFSFVKITALRFVGRYPRLRLAAPPSPGGVRHVGTCHAWHEKPFFMHISVRGVPYGNWYDWDGTVRLRVRPLLLPRLVKQAFDQIRQAAADNPAVLIRLLSTIGRLAAKLQNSEDRTALLDQATAVWETANTKTMVNMEREDIEEAWHKAIETITVV
jgi:Predicted membrane protein (DUF2254)